VPRRKDGSKNSEYPREMFVSVKTTAEDPEGDVLTYSYTISGGRIIGTGANVSWNLDGAMPGTYTITAAVDDGCGLCGAKVTKTVAVLESAPTPSCSCPDISISLKEPTDSYERAFTAQVGSTDSKKLTYNWTISDGTLVSGQGTPSIRVRLPKERREPGTV